jgi:hypothetical protein
MTGCNHDLPRRTASKSDGEGAGEASQHVLQGYCHTRAGDTDTKAQAAQAIFKEESEKKENREVSGKDDELETL